MERNTNVVKRIVELKKENQKLEDLINFVKMENFEYAMKCNHMENIVSNISSVAKNTPGKLLQASDNICNILQICNTSTTAPAVNVTISASRTERKPLARKSTPEKMVACNKAHVVKPHMVNGTILYIPTINLTRVSDLHSSSTSKNTTQLEIGNKSSVERCGVNDSTNCVSAQQSSSNRLIENESDGETGTSGESNHEFNNDNQHSVIEEVSEPSTSTAKSPSHSTVLSGTFQEVKIYLNQISPEGLNEESRSLTSKSRRSTMLPPQTLRTSRRHKRSNSNSFGLITKRGRIYSN